MLSFNQCQSVFQSFAAFCELTPKERSLIYNHISDCGVLFKTEEQLKQKLHEVKDVLDTTYGGKLENVNYF